MASTSKDTKVIPNRKVTKGKHSNKDHPKGDDEHLKEDDEHSEQNNELHKLLFPDGEFPFTALKFSVSYNKKLLDGWVKQPAPCCGAAAIAGAVNALKNKKRKDSAAIDHLYVVDKMLSYLNKLKGPKRRMFVDQLGAKINNVDLLIDEVCVELKKNGVSLEDREKATGISAEDTEKHWLKATRAIVSRKMEFRKGNVSEVPNIPGEVKSLNFCGALRRLVGVGGEGSAEGELDVFDSLDKIDCYKNKGKWWDGDQGLHSILKMEGGIKKLLLPKPSTGSFGNFGILGAISHLNDFEDDWKFTATELMGVGMEGKDWSPANVKKDDDAKQVDKCWGIVRQTFNALDTVILSHHNHHYALVYALREWEEVDGEGTKMVRQILTARGGQRPANWIGFNDMRKIWLGSDKYKFMKVEAHKNK